MQGNLGETQDGGGEERLPLGVGEGIGVGKVLNSMSSVTSL